MSCVTYSASHSPVPGVTFWDTKFTVHLHEYLYPAAGAMLRFSIVSKVDQVYLTVVGILQTCKEIVDILKWEKPFKFRWGWFHSCRNIYERKAAGHVYITLLGWLFGTSYGVRTHHPFRFYLPHSALCYRIITGFIIIHVVISLFIIEIYLQKDKCTVWLFVIYIKNEKEDGIKKGYDMISPCTAGQFL